MEDYNEVIARCKKQGIETDDCDIYIYPHNFNGQYCLKGTLSQDKKWVCLPEKEYQPDFDEYIYKPVYHEVKDIVSTYLKSGDMWYLVKVYLLYKTKVNV